MDSRHDIIELILTHAIEQGSYSEMYMDHLTSMTDIELEAELDRLETIAVYGGF